MLNTLKLIHFKNYVDQKVAFSDGINCILGKNGMGKTNLLDAMNYLSMTRSALNPVDQQNILYAQHFFALNSEFTIDRKKLKVNCYYEQGKKKIIKVNGKEVEKLSDHIGTIPSVLVTPDDSEIIKEGSEIRRKLFDRVLSQHDRDYLNKLLQMQQLLKQRNSLLKSNEGKLRGKIDRNLLKVYDEQLIPLFISIAETRKNFIDQFSPYFTTNYKDIFAGKESPTIDYTSDSLKSDFATLYSDALEKDIILQRTTKGAHKDDFIFKLNGKAIKKFGSQGQQKSFLIALKLSEYDYLQNLKGFDPMLLLDDIFDKLDDERIVRLVNLLTNPERFTQIFITDARSERSRQFFKSKKNRVHFYEIKDGTIQ